MTMTLTERQVAATAPPPLLPCPFCGATNWRAQPDGAGLQVHCQTCGAAYRLPVAAITRAMPPFQALLGELLGMLRQGQLAPGFSNEDWLAWLDKARRAVHSPPFLQP